ncbi:hypothetical protein QZH41_003909 [Actinostola sp. cb2023]|nr:hypothetical protein QZH41_003909 [Actinostola sp. cb2023]
MADDEYAHESCDAKPVKLPPRRTPPHQREVIDHQLDDLLAHGRIEPSQSPWSSPVVLVRKNDGSYRMSFEEHLHRLRLVFSRIRQAGLKLKPAKCQFLKQRVTFLGHVVSSQGIETDPEKTKAVVDWPVPVDVKELQRFLGLVGYYRRFVTEFSTTAEPLYRLCKKFTPFQWGSKEQMAFEELKKSLVSAPVLAYPNFSTDAGRFILDTDASQQLGIGAVLSQLQPDGTERVIAYGSRSLNDHEKNYCTTRLEMLAMQPEGQVARWLERLQEYDFDVEHRPGAESHVSKLTLVQLAGTTSSVTQDLWSEESLASTQQEDAAIGPVLTSLLQGEGKPTQQVLQSLSPTTRAVIAQFELLEVKNGVLYRKELKKGRATKGLTKRVHEYCDNCLTCCKCKPRKRSRAPLHPIPSGYPMQRIHMDIVGPLPRTKKGNKVFVKNWV